MRTLWAMCLVGLGTTSSVQAAAPVQASAVGARSIRFIADTAVRAEPSVTAPRIGVIGQDARALPLVALEAGNGCAARWIAIAPRGWICERAVVASADDATAPSSVSLHAEDAPELGVYGAVRGKEAVIFASRAAIAAGEGTTVDGALTVRRLATADVDGARYWVTAEGLIAERAIAPMSPSTFAGAAIDDGAVRVAWVHAPGKPHGAAAMRGAPSATAPVTGEVSARARVTVQAVSADGRWARITDTDWVARADLRIAELAAPPPGTGADERWFDVDLDQQILVAYEGARPVYATLVSTGRTDHETPTATARIASKLRTADMTSNKTDIYSVADVPWTMFYDQSFALHTSYWHDGFGDVRSHGCVNLAPRDARILYQWSSPDVPPGWIAVYGDEHTPGSLVRVRSHAVPAPAFRGYAKALHDQAQPTSIAAR